jgi:hypothetical protein
LEDRKNLKGSDKEEEETAEKTVSAEAAEETND